MSSDASETGGHATLDTFRHSPRLSLFFIGLLLAFTGYFVAWGSGYIQSQHTLLFFLTTLFGVFMAFNIGGNDVANSFGTSVGAGTLTVHQALLVAAIFEVSGAVIAGGEVTSTIRGGIVDLDGMAIRPLEFVFIMMSSLIAAALWLLFASHRGYPVSTTHSIVGAIIGGSVTLGVLKHGGLAALDLVQWREVGMIAISWVLSPALGGIVAYVLYSLIKRHILAYNDRAQSRLETIREEKRAHKRRHREAVERLSEVQQMAYTQAMARDMQAISDRDFSIDDLESEYYRKLYAINRKREDVHAHRALEHWVPVIAALGAIILTAMLLFKGFSHLALGVDTLGSYLIMGMVGALVWMATFIFAKTLKSETLGRSTFLMFSWMQVFTAAGFAFSHGSNDIANAIGPFAAVLDVLRTGVIGEEASIPPLAMLTFGVALIAGLWFIGREVIQTVGHHLTRMHPASGFSAELAASAVVMLATTFGLPVSSTHILIGAVLGIGMVNRQTNWSLMRPIALAWVITLPAAAVLAAGAFMVLNGVF
ncbi:inorganic phosphate transporter [Larsenimonas rhizosphaerae]|uniref:Phosphate transporter n=1 Tax=Larsenimonas rhizosphaerae TaxID=2944682 RepID=A0AA41ZH97_9GAMM|nr:inorganic phosphate transporter [Larsenimonas rhizosphaerae]MCX2524099.1 inorganic phosphate transporter [Larsenimonas rhizosphaerae]